MNELDKLRKMLDEAKIPYEDYKESWPKPNETLKKCFLCAADKYRRNQVIYGRSGPVSWKIDGICQYGSYGRAEGMIETYGELGMDEKNWPRVMTAEQVFEIIQKDWERSGANGQNARNIRRSD